MTDTALNAHFASMKKETRQAELRRKESGEKGEAMTDRYLFRGKRDGRWFTGHLHICMVTNHHHIIGNFDVSDESVDINLVSNEIVEVEPTSIGQSTGKRDINGKLLFEGDIILDSFQNGRYKVAWGDYKWKCHLIAGTRSCPCCAMFHLSSFHRFEIIGNIHDNPKLLARRAK